MGSGHYVKVSGLSAEKADKGLLRWKYVMTLAEDTRRPWEVGLAFDPSVAPPVSISFSDRTFGAFTGPRVARNLSADSYRPLVTGWRRSAFGIGVVLWAASVLRAVAWWGTSVDDPLAFRWLAPSMAAAWYLILWPSWFILKSWSAAAVNPPRIHTPLAMAVVVTKVPSEPWAMVRETLEHALRAAVMLPAKVDVWLADEHPSDETKAWCLAAGVRLSTRFGEASYHRASWPRRTRSKEGNLAYFFDTYGYDLYDVVSCFDSDHLCAPHYFQEVARAFQDPAVGYVAAPSICDVDADESWSARGRLFAEAALHGLVQAGSQRAGVPFCIGSHYSVRTEALFDIGGVGPELAEDAMTSVMMVAAGWRGAFAIDAEAHGKGPETFMAMATQEYQWSRSLENVRRIYWPQLRAGVGPAQRWRIRIPLLYYPLSAGYLVVANLLGPLAILLSTPWMSVSLSQFWFHAWPPGFFLVSLTFLCRNAGLLRPRRTKVVSWEAALFRLVRQPWMIRGVFDAVRSSVAERRKRRNGAVTSTQFSFAVTPKNVDGHSPVPMRMLVPYVPFVLVPAGAALLDRPASVLGYQLLCALASLSWAVAVVGIVVMNAIESGRRLESGRATRPPGPIRGRLPAVGWLLYREAGGLALGLLLLFVALLALP